MSETPSSSGGLPSKASTEWDHAYAQVGRTLLIVEASTPSIGIPWLPPTARVKSLRAEFFEPLKDFVRSSLVGVSTGTLESYNDDLSKLAADDESSRRLYIRGLSHLERYSLSCVLFVTCFALFFVSTLWARAGLGLAIGLSALTASVVTLVSLLVCSETSRRSTFHWIVFEEIMRRRGLDQPNAPTIPLYASATNET